MKHLSRRTLLALTGGTAASLSGCLGTPATGDENRDEKYFVRMKFTSNEPRDRSKIHPNDAEITEVDPIEQVIEKHFETFEIRVHTPTPTEKMSFLPQSYGSEENSEITEIEVSKDEYETATQAIEDAPNREVELNGERQRVIYFEKKGVLFMVWTAKE